MIPLEQKNKHRLIFDIDRKIKEAGFDLWGVAQIEDFDEFTKNVIKFYYEKRFYATMQWLANRLEVRLDPKRQFPEAKSIIVVAKDYSQPLLKLRGCRTTETVVKPSCTATSASLKENFHDEKEIETDCGFISNYAVGEDYHKVIQAKLKSIASFLSANGAKLAKIYVDTGPVFEKYWAYKCGIGWVGKNSLIINKKYGSYLFLGVIITDLEIEAFPSSYTNKSYCGSCVRCIKACPTGAIVGNGIIDSNKCIAYLTIEHRGVIPRDLREKMGGWIFGCDICQIVCPYNTKKINNHMQEALPAKTTQVQNPDAQKTPLNPTMSQFVNTGDWFRKKEIFDKLDLLTILNMSKDEFEITFRSSPIKRARYEGMIRNVMIALANLKVKESITYIRKFLQSESDVLRATAIWALIKLDGINQQQLYNLLQQETSFYCIDEIKWAITKLTNGEDKTKSS